MPKAPCLEPNSLEFAVYRGRCRRIRGATNDAGKIRGRGGSATRSAGGWRGRRTLSESDSWVPFQDIAQYLALERERTAGQPRFAATPAYALTHKPKGKYFASCDAELR
jgi:hypothetical protein